MNASIKNLNKIPDTTPSNDTLHQQIKHVIRRKFNSKNSRDEQQTTTSTTSSNRNKQYNGMYDIIKQIMSSLDIFKKD